MNRSLNKHWQFLQSQDSKSLNQALREYEAEPDATRDLPTVRSWIVLQKSGAFCVVFVIGTRGSNTHALCEKISEDFGYYHVQVRNWLRGQNEDPLATSTDEIIRYVDDQLKNSGENRNLIVSGFPRHEVDWTQWNQHFGARLRTKFVLYLKRDLNETIARLCAGLPEDEVDEKTNQWKKEFVDFRARVKPVFDTVSFRGLLHQVNASGNTTQVYNRARKIFGPTVCWLLGGPGSGKSTFAQLIAKEYGYIAIHMGQELKKAADNPNCKYDRDVIQHHLSTGTDVPPEIACGLLKDAFIKHGWEKKFVVDNFPRVLANMKYFDQFLADQINEDMAIFVNCGEEVLRARLQASHQKEPDHIIDMKLKVFFNDSVPVVAEFERRGMLRRIFSEGSVTEVWENVKKLFAPNVVFVFGLMGKRTQCSRICKTFNWQYLRVADLLRAEVARPGSVDAGLIKRHLEAGTNVPAEIAMKLLGRAMQCSGWNSRQYLIEFPRGFDRESLEKWNSMLGTNCNLDFCLVFDATDASVEHLAARRGQPLDGVRARLHEYRNETSPVIDYFASLGKIRRVNCNSPIEDVWIEVQKVFNSINGVEERGFFNYALCFLEPHASRPAVLPLVRRVFVEHGVKLVSEGQKKVDAQLIDSVYKEIANAAFSKPEDLKFASDNTLEEFKEAFGMDFNDALALGAVYNAQEYSEHADIHLEQLGDVWDECKVVRLATSIYVGEMDKGVFVINGFWPRLRAAHLDKNAPPVHWAVVKFDPRELSWKKFRSDVIGNADPKRASPYSIRGLLCANWESCGLESCPTTSDNGIRASSGPLQGLRDRIYWTGVRIDEDPYGQALLSAGIGMSLLKMWLDSSNMFVHWRYDTETPINGYLFDITSDRDSANVLTQLKQAALEDVQTGFLPKPLRRPFNLAKQQQLWNAFPMPRYKAAELYHDLANTNIDELMDLLDDENRQFADVAPLPHGTLNVVKHELNDGERSSFESAGFHMWESRQIAICVMAGATGGRFNFDGPIACYHASVPSGKSFLQILFEKIVKLGRVTDISLMPQGSRPECMSDAISSEPSMPEMSKGWKCDQEEEKSVQVPVVVLTSKLTHRAILNDLETHNYYGVDRNYVKLIQQGVTPLFDDPNNKKLLINEKARLELVPDGKGALFSSLYDSGTFDWLKHQNVEYLHCVSSEDLLCLPGEPMFIGAAKNNKAECAVAVSIADEEFELGGKTVRSSAARSPKGGAVISGFGMGWEDFDGDIGNYLFHMSFLYRAAKDRRRVINQSTYQNGCSIEWSLECAARSTNTFMAWHLRPDDVAFVTSSGLDKASAEAMSRVCRSWLEKAGAKFEDDIGLVEISPLLSLCGEGLQMFSGKTFATPIYIDGYSQQRQPADEILILHFNDVYNVEPQDKEPVGGVARFVSKVQHIRQSCLEENKPAPLVLFSGDAFNPSLMSSITKGAHMVPALNAINIEAACFGNHDFDFGLETLEEYVEQTNFPWIISNCVDKSTRKPLGNGLAIHTFNWAGRKIGLMGLIEREWLVTLGTINLDEVQYEDFVEAGRRLAMELRRSGCELVIAMTHMRLPNDELLAEEAGDVIDLICGGHDHFYDVKPFGKYGITVAKSGTDFRDLTPITVNFGEGRPYVSRTEHILIDGSMPEDPAMKELVNECQKEVGASMEVELCKLDVDLETRFSHVRTRETNAGNLVTDVMRAHHNCDVALLNGGTLRADVVFEKGSDFKQKDLCAILPMLDELCLLEMTGEQIIRALENGVSQYPKMEGRFLQLSGISFTFDADKPGGSRVLRDTIKIGGEPIDLNKAYTVTTKDYLRRGKDGFDVFPEAVCLADGEAGGILPVILQKYFHDLDQIRGVKKPESKAKQLLQRTGSMRPVNEQSDGDLPVISPQLEDRIICLNPKV